MDKVLDLFRNFTSREIGVLCSIGQADGRGSKTGEYWAGKSYEERHQHYLKSFGSEDSRRRSKASLRRYCRALSPEARAEAGEKISRTMQERFSKMGGEERKAWVKRSFHSPEARKKAVESIREGLLRLTPREMRVRMENSCLGEDARSRNREAQRAFFDRMSDEERYQWYKQSFGSEEALGKLSASGKRRWEGMTLEERKASMEESLRHPKSIEKSREGVRRYWAGLTPEQVGERVRSSILGSRSPTLPEVFLRLYLERTFPGEWAYNGDKRQNVVIGGRVPDFVNINGRKAFIEELGGIGYYHFLEDEKEKVEHYKKYGYECIIVFEWDCYLPEELDKIFQNVGT